MTQEELSKYISSDRLAHLAYQQTLFDAAKAELLQAYPGQYVAFEDGQVLDHDVDDRAMAERVYQKYGYRDILMQWVTQEETVYHVGGVFRRTIEA
jgi:predicted heme/steroid binding protein